VLEACRHTLIIAGAPPKPPRSADQVLDIAVLYGWDFFFGGSVVNVVSGALLL
jgi:hypothetical protein